MTADGKTQTGWFNYCPRCQGRYWVRAADLGQPKVRRFVDENSDVRHACPVAVAS